MFEIGNSLREARVRQGVTFPEVELATKIRGKYLRALEEEQFDALPAQTYVKGFLRAYAEYLGLDGQLYVDEYNSRFVIDATDEYFQPRRSPRRAQQERRFESRVLVLALLGIAALTALVFVAWRFGGGESPATLPTTPTSAAATAGRTQATVTIRAIRGSSFVEVHRSSALGVPLFTGTLHAGEQAQVFRSKRLWIRIRVPKAVRLTVNGKRVTLPKSHQAVLLATRSGVVR